MIASIQGRIIHKNDRFLIIETGGLGYKVAVTADIAQNLKLEDSVRLWTHQVIREDALDLYGFQDLDSLHLFQSLINVSGVGPRSALGILSLAPANILKSAIVSGNLDYLTKVSGIGRKIAEKVVVELKDKLDHIASDDDSGQINVDTEALEALKTLGYREKDAREALAKLTDPSASTSEKVKQVLKEMGEKNNFHG